MEKTRTEGERAKAKPNEEMASPSNHHDGSSQSDPEPQKSSTDPQSPSSPPSMPPTDNDHANPPRNNHPPPAIGYAPVMGYPPPHQPPPQYPPHYYQGSGGGGSSGYPYGVPQPTSYYPTNHPYSSPNAASGFARGVLTGLIILVILSCAVSIITYIIFRPENPTFQVNSFSVSDFNISNLVLMANWEANVTVQNPNEKLEADFERIQSFIYYQDPRIYLSWSTESPFTLKTNSSNTFKVKTSMINEDQPSSSVVKEMDRERRSGTVNFGLGIGLVATFKSGTWWMSRVRIRVYCDELKVRFAGSSGEGSLIDKNPKQCVVYT